MPDDDAAPYGCANHPGRPIVGETTTGVSVIPELADILGDGGLTETAELLCAACLTERA